MKLLCFQAKEFHWKTHSKTVPDVADQDVEETVREVLVVFLQAEQPDLRESRKAGVLRQALKHIKWLANKRDLANIVIHSFSHLGGATASADSAESVIESLANRLRETGYNVWITPFGYSCEWELSVFGESLAKVWKEIS
jgi:hypothetical protein